MDIHEQPYQLAVEAAVEVVVVLVEVVLDQQAEAEAQVKPLLHRAQAGSLLAAAVQRQILLAVLVDLEAAGVRNVVAVEMSVAQVATAS